MIVSFVHPTSTATAGRDRAGEQDLMSTSPAARLKAVVERARREALARIDRVPVAALVWGPNPTGADLVSVARLKLRDELRGRGHLADFSEDLIDPASKRSIFAQQLAQVESYDVVFTFPSSFGSVGELHDFSRLPGVSHKLLAFMDKDYLAGYSGTSLLAAQTTGTCKIEVYDASELPDGLVARALDQVYRLQELLYIQGRR